MPSCIRLDKAEQQLTGEIFREAILSKAIRKLNNYDFVIIDCRPTLGTLTVNALYASDFLIVPCEMSRYALEGFADLMDTIAQVRNTHNKQLIRILLTKFDTRNKVSNDWVLEQLVDFKDIIFKTLIRKNEALNQAHMHQEPIFSFKPDSYGAEDYKKLTKEVLTLCHQ
jgi:chromosome partitioning protein